MYRFSGNFKRHYSANIIAVYSQKVAFAARKHSLKPTSRVFANTLTVDIAAYQDALIKIDVPFCAL